MECTCGAESPIQTALQEVYAMQLAMARHSHSASKQLIILGDILFFLPSANDIVLCFLVWLSERNIPLKNALYCE